MKKILSLFLGILCLSVMASAIPAPLTIDHFVYDELNPNLIVTTGTPVLSSTQTDASILGGVRKVQATHVSGSGAVSLVRPLGPSFDYITCNTESGNDGAWEFNWGNTYAGGADLGDLTNGGFADNIIISFLAADAAVGVNMTVLPTGGGLAETVVSSTPIGPGVVIFPFSSYSFPFTSVDSLRFSLTSVNASDFAIDFIETNNINIPEPASLVLSGLLGLGLLLRRRR